MRSSGITEGVGQKFSENCPYKRYRGELRDRADRKKIKAIFGKIQSGPWSQQTEKARKDSTLEPLRKNSSVITLVSAF